MLYSVTTALGKYQPRQGAIRLTITLIAASASYALHAVIEELECIGQMTAERYYYGDETLNYTATP